MVVQAVENEVLWLEAGLNKDKATLQGKVSLLNKAFTADIFFSSRLQKERRKRAEIESKLTGKGFAAAEQAALGALENELVSLNYDSNEHEDVRQSLKNLEHYEQPKQRLEEAERLIAPAKEAAATAKEAAKELSNRLETNTPNQQEQLTTRAQ